MTIQPEGCLEYQRAMPGVWIAF